MKFVLVLLSLTVAVHAESCNDTDDCVLIECGDNYLVDCYQHHGSASKICTCIPSMNNFNCKSSYECIETFGKCNHGYMHCVGGHNAHCRCSNGHGGD